MKKIIFFLLLIFISNDLLAQTGIGGGTVPAPTYDITVIRNDIFGEGIPGHAHIPVTLDIKIGSTVKTNSFLPEPNSNVPKTYTFPVTASLPGFPPPKRYVRMSAFPGRYSQYYELSTVIGSHTTISADDTNLIFYNGQTGLYGYGADVYCTGTNQYTISIARFECYFCPPPGGGIITKTANPQKETALAPNPSKGLTEFNYIATDRETININVADINGKIVEKFSIEAQLGINRIPIDIQKQLQGTYIVQWKSNTGATGSLKLIKNQ